MQKVKYRGFELHKGGWILLIELEEQTFLGIKIQAIMGEVDLSRIQSLRLSHENRGNLYKWELSPGKQKVVSALETTMDKASAVSVYCFLGTIAAAATAIVFPPTAAAIIPFAKASLTSFCIGLSAAAIDDLIRRVKFVTIECSAAIPENADKLSKFTTDVWFAGRMETIHANTLYAEWKNAPKPGTDLVPVEDTFFPPTGDFQGEAHITIDDSSVGAVS